jgi:hypothetical protein
VVWSASPDGKKEPNAANRPGVAVNAKAPEHWSPFTRACSAYLSHQKVSGIGFALGKNGDGTTFSGVDLDKCRDPQTGAIEPWALEVIRTFDSYTEVSPSGTGVKVFVTGSLVPGSAQGKKFKLELYDRDRYFTVTGHHLAGTPLTIEHREEQLRALHTRAWGKDLREVVKLFGLFRGESKEWVYITCPWADEHTSGDTERDAALHVTDGKIDGFNCFHGHCQSRQLPDVLQLFGVNGRSVNGGDDGHRVVRITFASEIEPRPVHWLWQDRLALGTFALLAGREGIGKTTVA